MWKWWKKKDRGTGVVFKGALPTFFAALLLGRVPFHGVNAPLGLSVLLAATLADINPLFALLGLAGGALLQASPLWQPMVGGAAYVITLVFCRLFHRPASGRAKVILFALAQLAALPFALRGEPLALLWALLSVIASLPCGALLLRAYGILRGIGRRRALSDREQVTLCAGLSLALLALYELSYFGVSLAVICMALLSMALVYARGLPGVFTAALLPAALILHGSAAPALSGCLALCALLGTTVEKWGKPAIPGAFLLAALLTRAYWDGNAHAANAQNLILSGILFLAMPRDWLDALKDRLHPLRLREKNLTRTLTRLRRQNAGELTRMAKICGQLACLFQVAPPRQADLIRQWTVHGAMRVCSGCEARILCWVDAKRMGEVVLSLILRFDQGERVVPQAPIDVGCRHFSELITATHLSYHQALAEKAHADASARQNAYVRRQLTGVGRALAGLAGRIANDSGADRDAGEAQGLQASAAVVSVPEREGGVSGDATGSFKLPQSRMLYALSDGMGSGPPAREESTAAIALLYNLCRAGFSRELVYENVNRLLHARAQAEMYATLDAVTLDLRTGEAELMKYGAPPTYLARGGRVKPLVGEALPCGIVDEAVPSLHRFRLKKDDLLVLCSDGVYDRLGSRAENAIAAGLTLPPEQLAQALIDEARGRGQKDDMTVMVIRVA